MAKYLNSACVIAVLMVGMITNQNPPQTVKFDNLYHKALQAYLEMA